MTRFHKKHSLHIFGGSFFKSDIHPKIRCQLNTYIFGDMLKKYCMVIKFGSSAIATSVKPLNVHVNYDTKMVTKFLLL